MQTFFRDIRKNEVIALLYMTKYLSQFGRIKEEGALWSDAKVLKFP